MKKERTQPWIYAALPDSLFILSPPFLVLAIILLLPQYFFDGANVSPAVWIALVLCIDVAHVYSTLYRTYFDKETFRAKKNLFILTPLLVFICGVIVYSFSALLFWRIAAYLAVFHFIRQQYGFLKIYSRKENQKRWQSILDSTLIYALTLYPIVWWHLHGPRAFSWFVDGDFIFIHAPWLDLPLQILYWGIIAAWSASEIVNISEQKRFNIPRFFIIAGTGLSWYIGIIVYNGDLVFTALNVISHGIPYMALVWMHGNKKFSGKTGEEIKTKKRISFFFRPRNLVIFVGLLIFIAYLEEGFWDTLVWKDHAEYFQLFHFLPQPAEFYLAFIVPILTVPQLTHYVLDGYIWKMRKDELKWKQVTLDN